MEDPEPYLNFFTTLTILRPDSFDVGIAIGLLTIVLLLFISALVSGSEVAYFSLLPAELDKIKNSSSRKSKRIITFLNQPDRLLATILVTNNFVNVGIVVLSTFLTSQLFDFGSHAALGFAIQVVIFH